MKAAPDFIYRELDEVQVRGKHVLTKIYEPVCHKDEVTDDIKRELERQQIALNYFYDRNWQEASTRFEKLLDQHQHPYYRSMLDIIAEYNH
ncbi:MAG: hypothetical protein R3318_00380 [Gammaproteobacteria bacterium]|nr:hypothetical protein [Gammaproteobacteria bacterium]